MRYIKKIFIISLLFLGVFSGLVQAASPVVTSIPVTSIDKDTLYKYTLGASDSDSDTLTWSVKSGTSLPSWLTLSPPSWEQVGNAGFNARYAEDVSLAIDSNNTPYVVYTSGGDYYFKASAMKFDGSSWLQVGTAVFSAGQAYFTSIAFDSNDTPYVVYQDGGNSSKASVMKYDGSAWVQVGTAGFSAGSASYISIAFDSNDTPYVVYQDGGNSSKASVMKFDGSAWVQVGTAGFSAGKADYTSIAFDSNNTPYVVYQDYGNSSKASVMKFDGSAWVQVGTAGFSAGKADYTSIAFDSNNTPYVAYSGGGASVMKFNTYNTLSGTPRNADVGDYNISLTVSDGINTVDHNFTITVNYTNDAPTDITLSNNSVSENNVSDVTIGTLSATDIDVGDTHTFSFCGGSDDNNFTIDGATLKANGVFDYESKSSYSVCIRATDEANATFNKNITITITNVNDNTPIISSSAITSINQDTLYNYTLGASDSDGDALTWSGTSLPSWLALNPPSWEQVGNAGFSAGQANHTSIAIDSNNTPYVVYRDYAHNSKASVMKFNGSTWEQVGTVGFSAGQADYISIAIDSNDTPYVVYSDGGNGYKASVMKFNGSAWVQVGSSVDGAYNTSIAFDSSNTPYMVYEDAANGNFASVIKFNGSSWVQVGFADFSASVADYISIAIDSNDTPYVAYVNTDNNYEASVMKFNGSSWVYVGHPNLTGGEAFDISIAIDSNDTPYMVYENGSNGSKASVMKFNGTYWEQIGTAGFSAGAAYSTSIAFDSSNTPYVVYQDGGNGYKASVMKFDTSNILLSGTPSNADVGDYNISLTLSDGVNTVDHNFTITVNDIPTSSNVSFTIDEDTNKTFSVNDFNFTDSNAGDALESVYITTLQSAGRLQVNDVNVTLNQQIGATAIAHMKFIPDANTNGTPYATFGFKVNDGDANSTSAYTATINVTAVDDAPRWTVISDITKPEDTSDFNITLEATDAEGDAITYAAASSNPEIATVTLTDGKLEITPVANAAGVVTIEVNATSNGQTSSQTFELTLTAINDAPSFTTPFSNITLDRDNPSASVQIGIQDGENESEELNLTVSIENPSIVNTTEHWNNLISYATYSGETFNLDLNKSKSGTTKVTVVVDDNDLNATREFTVEVKASGLNPSIIMYFLN